MYRTIKHVFNKTNAKAKQIDKRTGKKNRYFCRFWLKHNLQLPPNKQRKPTK